MPSSENRQKAIFKDFVTISSVVEIASSFDFNGLMFSSILMLKQTPWLDSGWLQYLAGMKVLGALF
ncbi:hypothetical protein ACKI1H_14625 [Pseudomonas sp. YH-1]|uniref:hypothetical protein n=1 Tax=Pseudomonas sp. YH-1 TaxID=3384787 RepID=UPI003F80C73D